MNNLNERELEKLVMDNQGLVINIAKKYKRIELEDAIQCGNIGLIKALRGFDESLGYKFSTYATLYIQGEIQRELRDRGRVRIPRKIYDNNIKVVRYLGSRSGETEWITNEDIAEALGMPLEDVIDCKNAYSRFYSLDEKKYEESTWEERIYVPVEEDMSVEMLSLINELPEVERDYIKLYYINTYSQGDISKLTGRNQVFVHRKLKSGLNKLKEKVGSAR